MAPKKDWRRLGEVVAARRNELGLTQEQAAARGKTVSLATWRKLEAGGHQNFSARVLAGVARALDWTSTSVDAVLAGGEPTAQTRPVVVPIGPATETDSASPLRPTQWWEQFRYIVEQLSWPVRYQLQQQAAYWLQAEQEGNLHAVEATAKLDLIRAREAAEVEIQQSTLSAKVTEELTRGAREQVDEMLRNVRSEVDEMLRAMKATAAEAASALEAAEADK